MPNPPCLSAALAEFEDYVAGFPSHDPDRAAMYRLKKEHSLRVLENARAIAAQESGRHLPPTQAGLLQLAALYHDLGRFEQLRRFGTFRDADSLDHGRLGAQLLRQERFLRGLAKPEQGLVRLAVLLHNRYQLPARLAPALWPLCQALREADQLDILSIMQRELAPGGTADPTVALGLRDEAASYTPAVLDQASQGRAVNYGELRYLNDLRLLLCTWPFGLRFAASRRLLARQGSLAGILAGLPEEPPFDRLRAKMEPLLKISPEPQ